MRFVTAYKDREIDSVHHDLGPMYRGMGVPGGPCSYTDRSATRWERKGWGAEVGRECWERKEGGAGSSVGMGMGVGCWVASIVSSSSSSSSWLLWNEFLVLGIMMMSK